MGKQLVIKGADFSQNALDVRNKRYWYGVPDSQFEAANIAVIGFGLSVVDQSPIQGKTIHGIRLNVSTIGVMTIYKTSTNGATAANLLTEVATVQATEVGLQDLDFSVPVTLGANEYIVFGRYGGGNQSLIWKHHNTSAASPTVVQTLYYNVGNTTAAIGQNSVSLDVDFYTKRT